MDIWQDQVFRRDQFKRLRKSRYPWLQSEKDITLQGISNKWQERKAMEEAAAQKAVRDAMVALDDGSSSAPSEEKRKFRIPIQTHL